MGAGGSQGGWQVRIKHKTLLPRASKPAEISPEYQAEIDRSTAKLQQRYEKARKAAEKAAKKLDEVLRTPPAQKTAAQVQSIETELLRRLAELREIELLMTASPAGSAHRGREGWTKVPR
jgi:predicted secreted Zn-dependent protease